MTGSTEVVGQSTGKTSLLIRRIIAYTVLIVLVFISLLPFYLLVINATRDKTQSGIRWFPDSALAGNWRKLFAGSTQVAFGNVYKALLNSLIVSTCASVLSVYFSALTAYATYVYQFKLRRLADTFILMIMMVPTQASAIGFYKMMISWNLINSFIPLIVPAIAAPSIYYFMKQYMQSSLPLEIVEAARIDGCGEFRTFNTIVAPILKPAFAVQMIFTFVGNWNNFFMPRLILTDRDKATVPLILSAMSHAGPVEQDVGIFYLYMVLAILPVVVIYLILSKYIIRGVALGSVKG